MNTLKKWTSRVLVVVALMTLLMGTACLPVSAASEVSYSESCNVGDVSTDGNRICDGIPGYGEWYTLKKGATVDGVTAVSYSYMYGMNMVYVEGFIKKITYCRWWDGLLNQPCPSWWIFYQ